MGFVYLLQLQDNKYYIGRTDDIERRIGQHFLGNGAVWTRLFKPLSVISYEIEKDDWFENFKTLQIMKIYGIDKVRGGSWCMIELDQLTKIKLESDISKIDDTKSYLENKEHILKCESEETIEYYIERLNLEGIDSSKYDKDKFLWTKLIMMNKCVSCKEHKDITYLKPHCYTCWKKKKLN